MCERYLNLFKHFKSDFEKYFYWTFALYYKSIDKMTRSLTCDEINDMLSCIVSNPRIPEEIDECNKNNVRNIMRKQLEKISIYPDKIPELKKKMEEYYMKTQVPAGEMVGILASTSIGEPTTQLALNSFHSSGIAKSAMTTGVPRIEALLNAYKNLENNCGIYLYLKDADTNDIKQIRRTCMENYEFKTLENIITSMKILETKDLTEQKEFIDNQESWEDWHDYYDFMVSEEYKKCKWCVLIKINKLELYQRRKTMSEIASMIEKRSDNLFVVASSEEECVMIVYVDTSEVKSPNEVIGMSKKTKQRDDELGIEGLITSENKDFYYIRDIVVPSIKDLYVSGIKGIEMCYYEQSVGKNKEWKIETRGSNFRDVLNHPLTDYTKTISSNMWEVLEVLGIEATRSFLIDELLRIVSVSKRHIIQLVNMMTFFGNVRGANRHGVNSSQVKTLAKITFEEPLKHIKDASLISDTDYLSNVSSQLMLGKVCKAGTGIVTLMTDMRYFTSDNKKEEELINKEDVVMEKEKEVIKKEESKKTEVRDKELSNITGKSSCSKSIGKVKSRIFYVDENNLPLITEKNLDFL